MKETQTFNNIATHFSGVLHLSNFLQSKSDDVGDDDPFLQWWPSLHFHQDDVIIQHQVHQVGSLRRYIIIFSPVCDFRNVSYNKIEIFRVCLDLCFLSITYCIEPELGKRSIKEVVNLLPDRYTLLSLFTILLITFLRCCIHAHSAILTINIRAEFYSFSPHKDP